MMDAHAGAPASPNSQGRKRDRSVPNQGSTSSHSSLSSSSSAPSSLPGRTGHSGSTLSGGPNSSSSKHRTSRLGALSHFTPYYERRLEITSPSSLSLHNSSSGGGDDPSESPASTVRERYRTASARDCATESGIGSSGSFAYDSSIPQSAPATTSAFSIDSAALHHTSIEQSTGSTCLHKRRLTTEGRDLLRDWDTTLLLASSSGTQHVRSGSATPTIPGQAYGEPHTRTILASQTYHAGSSMSGGGDLVAGGAASSSSSSVDSIKAGHQGGGAYRCPNCAKSFARDDLLRRHLAREARAQTQPSLDRQKSCYECARSKARCDLEVPSCGRCRARGKDCVYGARSGNPNVRKSMRMTEDFADTPGPHWPGANMDSSWTGGLPIGSSAPSQPYAASSTDDYESSDDSHAWSGPMAEQQQYRMEQRPDQTYDYRDQLRRPEQPAAPGAQYGAPYPHPSYGLPHDTPILARGFVTGQGRNIDTSVSRVGPEEDEVTPINRQAGHAIGVMGPPLLAPSKAKEGMMPASQRPQVPRLLTGARMPRPQEAGQGSARPLFSAQLDLSGWLEEPVVPSPLYRMGPSFSSLGSAAFIPPTPLVGSNASQSLNAALMQQQQHEQAQHPQQHGSGDSSEAIMSTSQGSKQSSQVAARNWWAASSEERQGIDVQNVAQVCAGHFTLYPALMVLPDPTSPVPPLFHRPWLAQTRLETPAALAQVRVALAAYHVRLPASEAMIWDIIANQAKVIVASVDTLANASDMEVFASTAALWFLIILLLMSSDPNTGIVIGSEIVDASLVALSHLARILHQRVRAMEDAERLRRSSNTPRSFVEWGFEETARRTLFACYALFVLQRFRETSLQLQSQLADIDLILDIKLPASASEFEAGNELEWRAAQHIQITDQEIGSGSGNQPGVGTVQELTMRSLLDARRALLNDGGNLVKLEGGLAASSSSSGALTMAEQKRVLSYFDRHDDFTNVCLTTAFALDGRIV